MDPASTRSYDSTRRREAAAVTRTDVVAAAGRLFAERGWAGTSMRDIARVAGVSVETVYATAGSKAEVLKVALDVGVVGDDDPVPLGERPQFHALAVGPPRERVAAAADLLTAVQPRTAGLWRALEQGAQTDAGLAEVRAAFVAGQRVSIRAAITAIAQRPPTRREVDGIWAVIGPAVYLRLVEQAGWTDEDYREWTAEVLARLLGVDVNEDEENP